MSNLFVKIFMAILTISLFINNTRSGTSPFTNTEFEFNTIDKLLNNISIFSIKYDDKKIGYIIIKEDDIEKKQEIFVKIVEKNNSGENLIEIYKEGKYVDDLNLSDFWELDVKIIKEIKDDINKNYEIDIKVKDSIEEYKSSPLLEGLRQYFKVDEIISDCVLNK